MILPHSPARPAVQFLHALGSGLIKSSPLASCGAPFFLPRSKPPDDSAATSRFSSIDLRSTVEPAMVPVADPEMAEELTGGDLGVGHHAALGLALGSSNLASAALGSSNLASAALGSSNLASTISAPSTKILVFDMLHKYVVLETTTVLNGPTPTSSPVDNDAGGWITVKTRKTRGEVTQGSPGLTEYNRFLVLIGIGDDVFYTDGATAAWINSVSAMKKKALAVNRAPKCVAQKGRPPIISPVRINNEIPYPPRPVRNVSDAKKLAALRLGGSYGTADVLAYGTYGDGGLEY